MTWRQVTAYGLIAGIDLDRMQSLKPGLILDLFVYRRNYDDEQHGLTRKPVRIYD